MISITLRFAAIIALAIGILNAARNEFILSGNDMASNIMTMLSFVVFIAMLFYGMKTIRNSIYEDGATYGQVFYSGVLISVFTSIAVGFFTIVYFQFIRPDFQELIVPAIQKSMQAQKASAEAIQKEIELVKSGFSISNAFTGMLVYVILVMLIISAVLASFLRTKDTFTSEGPVNFGKN